MENKFSVITGASTGIGRAIAIKFGSAGATTFLIARRKEKLQTTKKLVDKAGGKAIVYTCDLSKVEDIDKVLEKISSHTDTVNTLINVAGIWHGKDEVYADINFQDFKQKTIIDTLNVGTLAPTLLVHGLLPYMSQGSNIINISDTFENGAKGWLPYYVSKRAIEDLTIGLAEELRSRGIRSNCISPSDTATQEYKKYFPEYMDEAIDPSKIAKFILDLCSEYRTETGKVFVLKKDKEPYEGFHS